MSNPLNVAVTRSVKRVLLILSLFSAVLIAGILFATLLSPELGLNEVLSRQYLEEDLHSFQEAATRFEKNLLKLRSRIRTIAARFEALQKENLDTQLVDQTIQGLWDDDNSPEGVIHFSGNRMQVITDLSTDKIFISSSEVIKKKLNRFYDTSLNEDESMQIIAEHDFGVPGYFGFVSKINGDTAQNIILVFPVDYLKAMGRSETPGSVNRSVIIFDKHNLPIVSSLGSAVRPVLEEVIDVSELPSGISFFNVSDHFALISVSRLTGWKLVQIVSAKDYASRVSDVRSKVFRALILLVVFLLASIVLLFFVGRSPVSRLFRLAKDYQINIQQGRSRADGVLYALTQLKDQNRRFESLLKQHNAAYKAFFFTAILKGTISDNENQRDAMRLLGMDFPNPKYMVIIYLSLKEKEKQDSEWSSIIRMWQMNEGIVHCASSEQRRSRTLTAILNLHDEQACYDILQNIIDGRKIIVGCGETVDGFGKIPHSFMQAQAALDYRFVLGRTGIIRFTELPFGNNEEYRYPSAIMDHLPLSLLSGDPEQVRSVFHELNDFVHNNRIPLYMARSIASETISIVSATVHKLSDTSYGDLQAKLDELVVTRFDTVDELFDCIVSLAADVCNESLRNSRTTGEIFMHRIEEYLVSGFTDPNFSIKMISEEFGMSPSSFSRFFKKQFGETFIQRIMRMKMEHACKLLAASDMPIVDVVHNTGYSDLSNFSRKFKREMSMTPAEYRKQARTSD